MIPSALSKLLTATRRSPLARITVADPHVDGGPLGRDVGPELGEPLLVVGDGLVQVAERTREIAGLDVVLDGHVGRALAGLRGRGARWRE